MSTNRRIRRFKTLETRLKLVGDGAWRMPTEAPHAEMEASIAQFADENGHRLVVRTGHHGPREVVTAAGAVEVTARRVNDRRVDPDTGERQRFLPGKPQPPSVHRVRKLVR